METTEQCGKSEKIRNKDNRRTPMVTNITFAMIKKIAAFH